MTLMPSRPPGSKQLALSAPVLDRYGLHARECACTRCEMGQRPSEAARSHARWAHEKAATREREAKAKADGAPVVAEKRLVKAERAAERERETREYIERVNAPVQRPATEEELRELRREFGLETRKDRRR
jgi:hypothetical protein